MKKLKSNEELTIYRVQHKVDGRGPFRPGFTEKWQLSKTRRHRLGLIKRKTLEQSFGSYWSLTIPHGFHLATGCRSIEQLLRWFAPEELEKLDSHGYYPVKMVVDGFLYENEEQVVFYRKRHLHIRAGKAMKLPTLLGQEDSLITSSPQGLGEHVMLSGTP